MLKGAHSALLKKLKRVRLHVQAAGEPPGAEGRSYKGFKGEGKDASGIQENKLDSPDLKCGTFQ